MTLPFPANDGIAVYDRVGEAAVVTITLPALSGDETAIELRGALLNVRESGVRHFILDLQNVSSMDSVCIGVLVELLTLMQQDRESGRIALVNADPSVTYLFRLTRLDRVFPICRDVMAALKAVEQVDAA